MKKIEVYGGPLVAWIPLVALIIFMIVTAATGNISLVTFSLGAFIALCLSFILTKNKAAFEGAVMSAMQKSTLQILIIIFLLAGVLSQSLRQSGLVNGLLWLTDRMHINAGLLPMIIFLTCVLISTSCGTTSGTIAAVTPVMFPLAVTLGCDPGVTMGAIMSGSIFGDNLAPISDTTIASALTQEADIGDVVKTRLPYSLIAGLIASILYAIVGMHTTSAINSGAHVDAAYAPTLIMLLIPVAMVIFMIRKWNLVSTLLVCDMISIFLNLVFGFIDVETMLAPSGPIGAGLSSMLNIIMFCILLFAILEVLEQNGAFGIFLEKIFHFSKTPRQAELMIAGVTVMGNLAIGGSTPAIVFLGPFVRKITKKFNIERTRGANILDGLSTAVCGMLPYNPSFIAGMGLAMATGLVGESFSFKDVIPYCYHSMALAALFLLSIITGIGRRFESSGQNTAEKEEK